MSTIKSISSLLPYIITKLTILSDGKEIFNNSILYVNDETVGFAEYELNEDLTSAQTLDIEIEWLDISSKVCYRGRLNQLNNVDTLGDYPYDLALRFINPNRIYILVYTNLRSIICGYIIGELVEFNFDIIFPPIPYITYRDYCNKNAMVYDNTLPSKYMTQYTYRYLVIWSNSNDTKPALKWIQESLVDGTYDKQNDNRLMSYHDGGRPKKIRVEFMSEDYSAFFWFDDALLLSVFDRFFGAHPETKTDFIIRIDAENKKYELALYRQGLKEPVVIPESAYQLIVFKNKFEDYRSENYNQPRGAWIW